MEVTVGMFSRYSVPDDREIASVAPSFPFRLLTLELYRNDTGASWLERDAERPAKKLRLWNAMPGRPFSIPPIVSSKRVIARMTTTRTTC